MPAPKEEASYRKKLLNRKSSQSFLTKTFFHILKIEYDKQIDSVDQLFAEREESEELPEDVAAYLKYKKETGRGFNDFVRLNKDLDEIAPTQSFESILVATEKGLDAEDIDTLMEAYAYDEDLDDESTIKKTKSQRKKAIAKAKDYFESEKGKIQDAP